MNKVTNTSKTPRPDWLFGGNPDSILAQESEGQKELISSSQLPVNCNSRGIEIEKQYASMGIKVIGKTKGDEIFFDVELPDGWKSEATDHSMWNNLKDDKGRIRANYFYKAAFYDRSAHINFCTRYTIRNQYFEDEKNPEKSWDRAAQINVIDTATGTILFSTDKHFYDGENTNDRIARGWLTKIYPDWQDINSYWD